MSRLTENSASVSDAINTRFSCRAFLDKPVSEADIKHIVETATRSPSGGNLQPWNVHVLQGEPRDKLVNLIAEKGQEKPMGEGSEYHIYPPELSDPYNSRRFEIGERMYEIMGVAREDTTCLLGAPIALSRGRLAGLRSQQQHSKSCHVRCVRVGVRTSCGCR